MCVCLCVYEYVHMRVCVLARVCACTHVCVKPCILPRRRPGLISASAVPYKQNKVQIESLEKKKKKDLDCTVRCKPKITGQEEVSAVTNGNCGRRFLDAGRFGLTPGPVPRLLLPKFRL